MAVDHELRAGSDWSVYASVDKGEVGKTEKVDPETQLDRDLRALDIGDDNFPRMIVSLPVTLSEQLVRTGLRSALGWMGRHSRRSSHSPA